MEVLQHFWNVFVVDALLGNFDRHNGNWGFLYHDDTQTATLAPIYDCGSCLLPQADAQVMRAVLSNQDELNARIYRFPTSAIKQNDQKINYYDFLMTAGNKDCNAAVMRMMPRFHLDEMQAFIREVPFLDELQRQFTRLICLPEWKNHGPCASADYGATAASITEDFICECKFRTASENSEVLNLLTN